MPFPSWRRAHFDWEHGWNLGPVAIEACAAEGRALHQWLVRELGEAMS